MIMTCLTDAITHFTRDTPNIDLRALLFSLGVLLAVFPIPWILYGKRMWEILVDKVPPEMSKATTYNCTGVKNRTNDFSSRLDSIPTRASSIIKVASRTAAKNEIQFDIVEEVGL